MASLTTPGAVADTGAALRPVRDGIIVAVAVVFALLTLYAVFIDQGALLAPLLGKLSFDSNFVHEFAHDARHVAGAPCH
ncbi:CbtB-domain containing protein [Longispora sp. NPDC051575]|uniref:CbtB domain-containing protein n=1 Tax=Longispora sp. NPDC051575 TaxID=3154943 RepID=UPI003435ABAB